MQINNLLKINLGTWLKSKGEYFIWQILILGIIAAALLAATLYAFNKFNQAGEILDVTSEIMLTQTGIVIDNVDIESFQRAEFIINYKQKTIQLPAMLRNIFFFNSHISTDKIKPGEKL